MKISIQYVGMETKFHSSQQAGVSALACFYYNPKSLILLIVKPLTHYTFVWNFICVLCLITLMCIWTSYTNVAHFSGYSIYLFFF